jgi:hypothetical protein
MEISTNQFFGFHDKNGTKQTEAEELPLVLFCTIYRLFLFWDRIELSIKG